MKKIRVGDSKPFPYIPPICIYGALKISASKADELVPELSDEDGFNDFLIECYEDWCYDFYDYYQRV